MNRWFIIIKSFWGVTRSAVVHIFNSAFSDEHETLKVESGLRIHEIDNLSWENTLIYANGSEVTKDYILKDNDTVTIRQFPSNGGGLATGLGWFFAPVTSLVHFFTSGSGEGAFNWVGNEIRQSILNAFKQETTDSSDVGQGEQIPTITGAKNRNGANAVIPLLIGESMYTPLTLAQSYTTISGKDGEEQYFHGLYCLGYKDIDLESVSLGIYELSHDEKNGTSGTLDCTNVGKTVETKTITYVPNEIIDTGTITTGSSSFEYKAVPAKNEDKKTQGAQSVSSEKMTAVCYSSVADAQKNKHGTEIGIQSVSVTQSGNIKFQTNDKADGKPVVKIIPKVNADPVPPKVTAIVTVETSSTAHYPLLDTTKRKGYHQQLELQQNGAEVSLYPQKVVQENFGTELMYPEGVQPLVIQPFSAKYPQKVQFEIMFQNLVHFSNTGAEESATVDICVGYSLDGGNTFQAFPAFAESSPCSITVTDAGTYTDGTGTYRKTRFSGHKNKNMRFVATKTFSFAEVWGIKNNVVEFKIFRNSVDQSVTDSKYQYKCYFSAIRTWCYDYNATKTQYEEQGTQSLVIQRPIIAKYRDMTARLGFTIRAGDDLKGTIDELNVLMMSRARTCNITEVNGEKVYTWSGINQTSPTNNPASLALMVLQHQMRGEYAYVGDEDVDEYFDMDSFGRFYEWCEETDSELRNSGFRKYTANGVLSKQMKTIDLVNQILNCGHGKLVINGNKYGVLYDKPDSQPVMVLNNQNVLEAKNSKNFDDEIDGYSCRFIDSLNDYQEDTQIFVPKDIRDPQSPTYKPASEYKLESIDLPWITDVKRAYRMCMYMLACRKLRPESWEVKMSVDGALVDVGSIVSYQSDTLAVGIGDGAQIAEVNTENGYIVSIKVDYGFTVADTTKTYGIKVQHADATNGVSVRTYELASFSTTGTKDVLVFAEPIDTATVIKPSVGDIVSFGLYEKITTDAICLSKKSNENGTYTLNLVPYQDNIYQAELGIIPDYVSNVTAPKDAGVEVEEEIPSPTYEDVHNIAQATVDEGSDTPPTAPNDFTATFYENYIELKCEQSGTALSDAVKYFEWEITKGSGAEPITVTSSSKNFNYMFDRSVDGYPELSTLNTWSFRVRVVNIYGIESTWTTGTKITTAYGTWLIPNISVSKEVVDRTAILTAVYGGSRTVYGRIQTTVKIKRLGNSDPVGTGTFNDLLGITADSQFYLPEFDKPVQTSADSDNEINYRVADYSTLPAYPQNGDRIHYTGTDTQTVQNGKYYQYDGTSWVEISDKYISDSNKITHTLPLIGQTYRIFKAGNVLVKKNNNPVYTKDVPDVVTVPQNPSKNDVIHFVGNDTTVEQVEFIYNNYYAYLNSTWEQVYSKALIVPTNYVYQIQMQNEAGSSNSVTVSVDALCTNVADIVHSHEHYKDLYVEKLSAINANLGMISQGGMGSFEEMLNYWALSDLSAEDSGVNGGVKKGAFRVGGESEYFKVIPKGDGNYTIELRAGNIELTTDVSGESAMDFANGTYIYNNDRTGRMILSSDGIVIQKLVATQVTPVGTENPSELGWYIYENERYIPSTDTTVVAGTDYYTVTWEIVAKVFADERRNMIISNAEDTPDFGFKVTGDIYHFDDIEHITNAESGTNPQSISGTGTLEANKKSEIVLQNSSPYYFKGNINKDVSSFTGNVVFITKAEKIVTSLKGINIDGTIENAKAPLTGYNEAMRTESSVVSGVTVGSYLGLSREQIQQGIFY